MSLTKTSIQQGSTSLVKKAEKYLRDWTVATKTTCGERVGQTPLGFFAFEQTESILIIHM